MNIGIVGLGYVGGSLATFVSEKHKTYLFDINEEKIKNLIFRRNGSLKGRFVPCKSARECAQNADIVFLCLPTNLSKNGTNLDTDVLKLTLDEIVSSNYDCVVVIKSTIPVGFARNYTLCSGASTIVYCPEFLRESKALYDIKHPSRLIIGCDLNNEASKKSASFCESLYLDLYGNGIKNAISIVGYEEAESIKLFSNAYLALRVAFFNELDNFSASRGLNTKDIINGVCSDPRIGLFYNNPSFGFGGGCLPKDSRELASELNESDGVLIKSIEKSNSQRINAIAKSIALEISNRKISSKDFIGFYRLISNSNGCSLKCSSNIMVLKALKQLIPNQIVIYEPLLLEEYAYGCQMENNIDAFKRMSSLIVSNRMVRDLDNVKEKTYTRDVFGRD